MIKSELIDKLAEENPHLRKSDVVKVVETILDEISGALAQGDRVELRGFGSFAPRERPARVGRNPRNGTTVEVPERSFPHFRPGKEIKAALQKVADKQMK